MHDYYARLLCKITMHGYYARLLCKITMRGYYADYCANSGYYANSSYYANSGYYAGGTHVNSTIQIVAGGAHMRWKFSADAFWLVE